MAQTIKIKRSTSSAQPASALSVGELAYSFNSNKLFIGDGSNNDIIGGQLYTNMLDHTAGTLTASSAIIVDSNSKIDNLLVDNLQLNGNTISSGSGNITISSATGSISVAGAAHELAIIDNSATAFVITEGSNAYLTFKTSNSAEQIITHKQLKVSNAYTLPTSDGSNGQVLTTNGSGAVSFATISTTLSVGADSGSNDTVSLVSDTLDFTGGEGIDTTVSNNEITIAAEVATASNLGVASFDSTDFSVSSGAVSVNAITLGSSALNPGATTSTLAGLQSLAVDNVTVNGNDISTTNSNGNLTLSPNGTGTVTVPSGYKDRSGFGATSLATKEYVDAVKTGLDFKDSVRVASTANVDESSAPAAIDGVTLSSGDRVLLKNQSTGSENGIYVFNGSGSAMTRATDADADAEVTSGLYVFVEAGTVNSDTGFVLTTDGSITVGSTALTFTQFSGAGQITAGDALTKSGNTLNVAVGNTIQASSDILNIKGVTSTAVGDLLIGQASNAGYTVLSKPGSNGAFLTMGTSGSASWTTTIDGGTF
jgi:hypothetical protein|tara:strand:+ start:27 stop:1643 length:1617 start_codon:yes stop_codon:yes gene_type:complete